MNFIEIEYRKQNKSFNMSRMQFHDYFELYFLLSGNREVFVNNKLFELTSDTMCIIPPFSMHKTEGSAYERINLYISKNLLTENEYNFLLNACEYNAFRFTPEQYKFLTVLLKEVVALEITDFAKRSEFLLSFTKTIIAFLQTQALTPLSPSSATTLNKSQDTVILQVVAYINKEYSQNVTLDTLQKKFYISKNTLCRRFIKQLNCSPMQYLMYARLNVAKMYLSTTNKSIGEIAELCGFSSANYFGLIFKKQIGISPSNYRKKQ